MTMFEGNTYMQRAGFIRTRSKYFASLQPFTKDRACETVGLWKGDLDAFTVRASRSA